MEPLKTRISNLRSRSLSAIRFTGAKRSISPFSLIAELLSGLLVGALVGYWSDRYWTTTPLFIFLFSVFGILAGVLNASKTLAKSSKVS